MPYAYQCCAYGACASFTKGSGQWQADDFHLEEEEAPKKPMGLLTGQAETHCECLEALGWHLVTGTMAEVREEAGETWEEVTGTREKSPGGGGGGVLGTWEGLCQCFYFVSSKLHLRGAWGRVRIVMSHTGPAFEFTITLSHHLSQYWHSCGSHSASP